MRKMMTRKSTLIILSGWTISLLFLATCRYSGFYYYHKYQNLRSEARSIEREFPTLESFLIKAVGHYKNPEFYKELGRLYLDRAMAENKYVSSDKRDAFLDKAIAAIAESIKRNPVDSWAYLDLGKVYMLYNFPLLTYAERARQYLRKSLEYNPINEFLNLNVLYFHLIQWDRLDEVERGFVWDKLERNLRGNPRFGGLLRGKWIGNAKTDAVLKLILMDNQKVWDQIKGAFK